jgi:hypothetical protein
MSDVLYPPEKPKMDPKDYERVPVGKFVSATIAEVQYEQAHEFKGKNAKTGPAIRFKFEIDGLKFPHYSKWMTFSYGEKSTLYSSYLVPLVEGAKPDMKFNIRNFDNLRVNMVWLDNPKNPDFQIIQVILPLDERKIIPVEGGIKTDESVPF